MDFKDCPLQTCIAYHFLPGCLLSFSYFLYLLVSKFLSRCSRCRRIIGLQPQPQSASDKLYFFFKLLKVCTGEASGENDDIAAEIAAEEAAAAAVEEAAEGEEDDDADALDEDADSARYDPERRHPLSEMPPSATDVQIGHAFLSGMSVDKKTFKDLVTLGDPVETVVAFSNQGRTPYHVWGVIGSLNRDTKFSVYVQNFSYTVVNKTINSGEELSFKYEFTPNERLDIRPFQLAITTFYEARSSNGNSIRGHSSTFYNSTVLTQPSPNTMSNGVFLLFCLFGITGAVGMWYVWKKVQAVQQKEVVEMGTTDPSKNEWLEDHHNMISTGGGRAKRRLNVKK